MPSVGAERLQLRLLPIDAATPDELRALTPAALANADGMVVVPEGMFWNNRKTIVDLATRSRVPAIYPERDYADDGGLIGYGPNAPEHFRQAAGYVDRILRGAGLPISRSTSPRVSISSSIFAPLARSDLTCQLTLSRPPMRLSNDRYWPEADIERGWLRSAPDPAETLGTLF